jgi:hypothetical protein
MMLRRAIEDPSGRRLETEEEEDDDDEIVEPMSPPPLPTADSSRTSMSEENYGPQGDHKAEENVGEEMLMRMLMRAVKTVMLPIHHHHYPTRRPLAPGKKRNSSVKRLPRRSKKRRKRKKRRRSRKQKRRNVRRRALLQATKVLLLVIQVSPRVTWGPRVMWTRVKKHRLVII